MTTALIIQARMTSTRLPGKVLLPLAGQPMLARMLERLRLVKHADQIIVATTNQAAADPIVKLCESQGFAYFRGSEQDVLSRYAQAANEAGADTVVRLTSDCPLIDPGLVDTVIEVFSQGSFDFVSNMLEPSFPYGMAVEVFSNQTLQLAHQEATQPSEREHVTAFIYRHPERFRLKSVTQKTAQNHHRWTVDTPEDYQLVKNIFEALYATKPNFDRHDALSLLEQNPDWSKINSHIQQVKL